MAARLLRRYPRGRAPQRTAEEELAELQSSWNYRWDNGWTQCATCGGRFKGSLADHAVECRADIPSFSDSDSEGEPPLFSTSSSGGFRTDPLPFFRAQRRSAPFASSTHYQSGKQRQSSTPFARKPQAGTRYSSSSSYTRSSFPYTNSSPPPQPPPKQPAKPPAPPIEKQRSLTDTLVSCTRQWDAFLIATSQVTVHSVPWPPSDLVLLLHRAQPDERRSAVKSLLLRYHPDKMVQFFDRVPDVDRDAIRAKSMETTKLLTGVLKG
ncbi:hypothetical protein DIPPA_00727 [Diplonema papillatum]|nr:hypothetical protein DIPPA_00727 [Diplonema papillatum]